MACLHTSTAKLSSDLCCRFYFWAVQQAEAGFVGVDGRAYPPRWQLREQTVSASHHLL